MIPKMLPTKSPTANLSKIEGFGNWIIEAIRLFRGRILRKAGLTLLTFGTAMLAQPWWEPILEALFAQRFKLETPSTMSLGGVLIIGGLGLFLFDYLIIKWTARRELARAKFNRIYLPLESLICDCYVTSSQAILAPYLSKRVKAAFKLLHRRLYIAAIKSLFDRRVTKESAEVEFGKPFPLKAIRLIVEEQGHLADSKLLNCIAAAERSIYENHGSDPWSLTGEEFELFKYVHIEADRLRAVLHRHGMT